MLLKSSNTERQKDPHKILCDEFVAIVKRRKRSFPHDNNARTRSFPHGTTADTVVSHGSSTLGNGGFHWIDRDWKRQVPRNRMFPATEVVAETRVSTADVAGWKQRYPWLCTSTPHRSRLPVAKQKISPQKIRKTYVTSVRAIFHWAYVSRQSWLMHDNLRHQQL